MESADFGTFAAVQVDNAAVRGDVTGGLLQTSLLIISDTGDLTAYDATNDGNPQISYGASAAERLTIATVYDSGAQTLDYVQFATAVASVTADKGLFRFAPDGDIILDIDDGGINFAASKGISIAGTDILTDVAGTATLSNIDALDATTEATIEAAIDTLVSTTLTTPDINAGTADSLTSLSVRDTSAAFDLKFAATSSTALTAGRNFIFDVVNADRTIKLQGNIDLAGSLTTAGALITSGANSLTFTTTGATNVTVPTTGTLATLAGAETLSGKTLTAPKFASGWFIADSSGNELIKFALQASAVNEVTVTNAPTANAPSLSATGGDTNIILSLLGKGTGGIAAIGTSTNDAAPAGYVGEYLTASAATGSNALATGVKEDIASISLTAGDWDVSIICFFSLGATTTLGYILASLSATSVTHDLTLGRFSGFPGGDMVFKNQSSMNVQTPPFRISLASTTPLYVVGEAAFSVSTCAAGCIVQARRVR